MKCIYRKCDNVYNTDNGPSSFEVFLNKDSEFYTRLVLSESEHEIKNTFSGNIAVYMKDSVITIHIRHMYFRVLFEAFVSGALVIKYHGYLVIPDINAMTLSDHIQEGGGDSTFNRIKFPAKFDFQISDK